MSFSPLPGGPDGRALDHSVQDAPPVIGPWRVPRPRYFDHLRVPAGRVIGEKAPKPLPQPGGRTIPGRAQERTADPRQVETGHDRAAQVSLAPLRRRRLVRQDQDAEGARPPPRRPNPGAALRSD